MILTISLLVLCLGSLAWYTRKDLVEYRAFKLLTATADRQHRYRAWLVRSFLLFFCVAVAALAILGRLHALVALPAEFLPLSSALQSHTTGHVSSSFFSGFAAAAAGSFVAGIVASMLIRRRGAKRPGKSGTQGVRLGDVQALLPRNRQETLWTALLSINAGMCEEIYFRLLLPLLLALIIGNALAAFVIAAIIFGLAHIYQGIFGILATMIVGAALTALYLWTGSIWIAAMVHALIDLMSLVLRPSLERLSAARASGSAMP